MTKGRKKETWKIDPDLCSGCKTCEVACSIHHEGELTLKRSRIRIVKWEDRGVDVPVVCQHCESPACAHNCPTGALRGDESGIVLYDRDLCVGCKLCFLTCPVGGISLDEDGSVLKCDLCGGDPHCAEFCPSGAIEYLSVSRASERQKRKAARAIAHQSDPEEYRH